jgi:hypothetical protein
MGPARGRVGLSQTVTVAGHRYSVRNSAPYLRSCARDKGNETR